MRFRSPGRPATVLLSVLAVAGAMLAVTSAAVGGGSTLTQRDYRLREINAYLGDPANSFVEFSGTITPQALDAGLMPWFWSGFTATASITCSPRANPTAVTTATVTSDVRDGVGLMQWTQPTYTHADAGSVKWTVRFTFASPPTDDFSSWYWCVNSGHVDAADDPVLRSFTLTGVRGMTWASSLGLSPVPGMMLYGFNVGPGGSIQHIQLNDGVQY
jgi:hypothetical protein